VCPVWLPVFFLFFYNGPELGAGNDPGMALTPFPTSILDEMRFEPTTFKSSLLTSSLSHFEVMSKWIQKLKVVAPSESGQK